MRATCVAQSALHYTTLIVLFSRQDRRLEEPLYPGDGRSHERLDEGTIPGHRYQLPDRAETSGLKELAQSRALSCEERAILTMFS